MKHKFITLLLAMIFILITMVPVSNAVSNDTGYETRQIDGTSAEIIGYTGDDTSISIPEKIDGMSVTSIGENAFFEKDITDAIIPSTVTEIHSKAFGNCKYLRTVTFTGSKPDISDDAFENAGSELSENTLILFPSFRNDSRSNDITSSGRLPENVILSEYDVPSTGAMNTSENSSDPLSIIIVIGIFVTIGTVTVIVTVRKREKNEKDYNTDELS